FSRDWSSDVCSSDLRVVLRDLHAALEDDDAALVLGEEPDRGQAQIDLAEALFRLGLLRDEAARLQVRKAPLDLVALGVEVHQDRSEERRVGREWRRG